MVSEEGEQKERGNLKLRIFKLVFVPIQRIVCG